MAGWVLVPCLDELREELNVIAPNRDTSSDGTIGDVAHQQRSSDHNDDEVGRVPIKDADAKHEVHAYDGDRDLRSPDVTMEDVVQHILARCRSGAENRLRYIIFNRRIWEASNGWKQRAYAGDNPHDQHAHFSSSYETAKEADRSPWGLRELVEDGVEIRLPVKGDTGQGVREWQYRVKDLGYDPGTVDGIYGDRMESAVNAYRKAYGQGPDPQISGWTAWHMRRTEAQRYAGKNGAPGAPGAPGKDGAPGAPGKDGADGKDGVLTGTLTITGGTLTAVDEGAQ